MLNVALSLNMLTETAVKYYNVFFCQKNVSFVITIYVTLIRLILVFKVCICVPHKKQLCQKIFAERS
jgi:hypothetical protein